jgi:hypothetical protein
VESNSEGTSDCQRKCCKQTYLKLTPRHDAHSKEPPRALLVAPRMNIKNQASNHGHIFPGSTVLTLGAHG